MVRSLRSGFEKLLDPKPGRTQPVFEREIARLKDHGILNLKSLNRAVNDLTLPKSVRLAACWALGQVGGSQAVRTLLRVLRAGDSETSFEAAKSLIALENKTAVRLIASGMTTGAKSHNRAAAAYALGFLGGRSNLQSLLRVVEGNDTPEVRSHAAEALGHLGNKLAVKHLIRALKDEAPEVRYWSAFALGEIGDRKALPFLEETAVSDASVFPDGRSVKSEAKSAIERIRK